MVQNCHLPLTRPVTVNAGLALYRAARGDAVIVTRTIGVLYWLPYIHHARACKNLIYIYKFHVDDVQ